MLFSILATDLGRPRSVHLNEAKTTAGEPRPGPAVVDDDAAARNSLKFSLELEGGVAVLAVCCELVPLPRSPATHPG